MRLVSRIRLSDTDVCSGHFSYQSSGTKIDSVGSERTGLLRLFTGGYRRGWMAGCLVVSCTMTTSVLIPQKRNSRTASEDRLVSAPCPKAGSQLVVAAPVRGKVTIIRSVDFSFDYTFSTGTTVQFGLIQSSIFRRLASIIIIIVAILLVRCRLSFAIRVARNSDFASRTRTACALGRLQPALPR